MTILFLNHLNIFKFFFLISENWEKIFSLEIVKN